ncbi:MAG: TonB family protein [Campylobacterales bacterium]
MNRYFKSFFLTLFLYIIIIGVCISFLQEHPKVSSKKEQLKKLKVSLVTIVEPTVLKKEILKPNKKIIKQKKVIKPKIKKVIRKKHKQKKVIHKKIVKKKPVKKVVKKQSKIDKVVKKKPIEPKPIVKSIVQKKQNGINDKKNELKKQKYYKLIKQTITLYKKYPKKAIRRGVQGFVKVKFIVSANGELVSIDIIDGKKIFYKSVKKAIKKTFPLSPPKGVFSKNFELEVKLVYRLR